MFADQQQLASLRAVEAGEARSVQAEREEEARLRRVGGPGYAAWRRDDAYAWGEVRRRYRAAREAETAAEEDVASLAAMDGRVERDDEGLGGVPGGVESEGRREQIHRARIDGQVRVPGRAVAPCRAGVCCCVDGGGCLASSTETPPSTPIARTQHARHDPVAGPPPPAA